MKLVFKTACHEVWLGSHGMLEIWSMTRLVDVTNTETKARYLVAQLEAQ